MPDTPEITDNAEQHRFEARLAGELAAEAQYRLQGDTVTFTHTQVQPQYEGQGLGSRLAQYALDNVRERKLKVVAQCEFIAAYIERHPDYAVLLARQGA